MRYLPVHAYKIYLLKSIKNNKKNTYKSEWIK
jgi:hypothetical protein